MSAHHERTGSAVCQVVSFDCYGTLIDWERGLADALRAALPGADDDHLRRVVEARGRLEWALLGELTEFRPYREILAETVRAAAGEVGTPIGADGASRVASSIGSWPPFPEVPAALERLSSRFSLAIASNVDRVDLAATLRMLGLADIHTVTAEDVRCFKPEPDHLLALLHELGIDEDELLHASAYPDYDLLTAQDLGIPCAYVDRTGQPPPPELELAVSARDLSELADWLVRWPRAGRRPRR
ncbi:MAG: HAD family hydrolase [Acidobacteriota bacterium]|nr:HAD family hydrolase [Acidobacteriota bacterium]